MFGDNDTSNFVRRLENASLLTELTLSGLREFAISIRWWWFHARESAEPSRRKGWGEFVHRLLVVFSAFDSDVVDSVQEASRRCYL